MKYKIYLITNTLNGKKYVGQTKAKVWKRWSVHKYQAKAGNTYRFYNAVRKYGPEIFEVLTLENWDLRSEANDAEEWWIKILDTTNDEFGYNIKSAAEGKELPQSIKDKISTSHKQRFINNPELREQRSKINKGRKFSDGAKVNMSNAHEGKKLPAFTKKHKQRLSESNKLAWKNRERFLGPRSEEVKNQIAEGLKAYHANLTPEEKELRAQKAREKSLAYYAKKSFATQPVLLQP